MRFIIFLRTIGDYDRSPAAGTFGQVVHVSNCNVTCHGSQMPHRSSSKIKSIRHLDTLFAKLLRLWHLVCEAIRHAACNRMG